MKWMILFIAGGVGTMSRYFLSGAACQVFGTRFPYGTLTVNLLGCLIAGILANLSQDKFPMTPNVRLLLIVGFLGAFTTFSAFIMETANLIKDGAAGLALINVLASVTAGFLIFQLGVKLGELL